MAPILMKGNEAIGEAAIIAGCRFYFGYPITPQNELPAYMSLRLPKVGGTFLQAESEVAAINMVFGASAAGARVMTSSSSPGISLKMEGISYMAGAELPAVVVNMMRGGPGLGNIAGAQGDYFQAVKGGGHGDYHSIVLAPSGVQELADLTVKAFDLADRYRIVVILLGDGFIGQMSEPIVLPQPSGLVFDKSSWSLSGAKDRDTHHIVSLRLNPEDALEKLNIRLQEKYREIEEKEPLFEELAEADADFPCRADLVTIHRHSLYASYNVFKRNGLDIRMSKSHHRPELLLPDDTDGSGAETEGDQPVKRCGCTAALQVTKNQRTCLFNGMLCNFFR